MSLDLTNVDDPFGNGFKESLKNKKALVYHGTSDVYFWDIINNGFTYSIERRNWNTSEGNYFSYDLMRAEKYYNRKKK